MDYGAKRYLAGLFGVKLVSDIRERLCALGMRPRLDRKRRERLQTIAQAGTLFIHVPKNAGMSISTALYGRQIKHASIRYYAMVAPELLDRIDSFAVIRNPVDRFLSAYGYGKAGGTADNRVSAPFRDLYMGFGSVDDALDHIEQARSPFAVDHIFRPQSWYLHDQRGLLRVKRLVPFDQLQAVIGSGSNALRDLPAINRRQAPAARLSPRQVSRIRRLYAQDVALWEACSAAPFQAAGVGAALPDRQPRLRAL